MNIVHDGTFDLAVGKSRKETSWKNREFAWSDFLSRIKDTHRTPETQTEYAASKKDRQDEIKDIGGFVGGYINGGRRKADSILHRQLITLDIDFANVDMWEDFVLVYGNAAALYSTHKHSASTPRFRLILPLSRPVARDEYAAISRRIAGVLGIELFDDTTYEPSRLMYWPSTSKDGDYVFEYQDGEWLDADQVLASYRNWKNTSEWPVSNRLQDTLQRAVKKQGDPLTKGGIIGAFCRTYTIQEVISTFLADEYEHCDAEGRYTYKGGSTAGGLVVYEDKFAYSHHGTDPSSGKLCNAFDLVRLHRFGLRDENCREETPINKRPSFMAMEELAAADSATRKLLGKERIAATREDFEGVGQEEEEDDEWLEKLDTDKKGKPTNTISNIRLIMDNDPKLKDKIALDLFSMQEVAKGHLPWWASTPASMELTDTDEAGLAEYLEKKYEITNLTKIRQGLDLVSKSKEFHPIREYLTSLKWDGKERIDTLFVDYMGVSDSEYTRAVSRKMLIAAVRRVFQPGCKFDNMLVLAGEEGKGKSSLFSKLAGKWFSDTFVGVKGKESLEQLQGTWIMEIQELAGLKKADAECTKAFLSGTIDQYRVAYGRRKGKYPRQCVFFGTCNDLDFLQDAGGNRRYWPLTVWEQLPTKDQWVDFTKEEIDQVWAEAVAAHKKGEQLHLPKGIEAQARAAQKAHQVLDAREGVIRAYLDKLLPQNWSTMDVYARRNYMQGDPLAAEGIEARTRVCAAEVWCECLGNPIDELNRYNTKEINDLLRRMEGWSPAEKAMRFGLYGLQRGHVKA